MTIAFIGLGSNLNSPRQHIVSALASLNELPSTSLLRQSSLYKSKPVGPQDQDDYINAVAEIETGLVALDLLDNLQAIEKQHGRVRNQHWGPRTLDLDILMYGNEVINDERLIVPHPEMLNRAFVLVPLAEIQTDCEIPDAGAIKNYLENIDRDGLELIR